MTSTNGEARPSKAITIDTAEASEELQTVVDAFNAGFRAWMQKYGCRAEFAWRYGTERTQIKGMEIQAIDMIVYRKPAPQFEIMKEKLSSPS